jgi:hypothetical protein
MSTLKVNALQDTSGNNLSRVLQVVQTVKTDTASESCSAGVPSSTVFCPVNITPSSSSSKLLVMVTASVSDNGTVCIILTKDGSALDAATGDADSSRERTTASTSVTSDSRLHTINASYLDTAGGTSQITYGFKLFVQDNNTSTIYLNRMADSYDHSFGFRQPSMVQVLEIAA